MAVARRARGERRRQEILKASFGLVARNGAGSITHRAVADEAGVPLAATTYYFASKHELLRETLEYAARRELEAYEHDESWLAAQRATSPGELAETLAVGALAYLEAADTLAHYEVFLAAGREPSLAETANAWTDANVEMLEPVLERLGSAHPTTDAHIVTAMIDGLVLEQLAGPRADFADAVLRPALQRTLAALLDSPIPDAGASR
jgi:DNA-binding transcriptional regulator YbjK